VSNCACADVQPEEVYFSWCHLSEFLIVLPQWWDRWSRVTTSVSVKQDCWYYEPEVNNTNVNLFGFFNLMLAIL